jgi:hypothetical protein
VPVSVVAPTLTVAYTGLGTIFVPDSTTADITITPPQSGCLPVRYTLAYSLGSSNGVYTTVKMQEGMLRIVISSLRPGETYFAYVEGTCADATVTATSAAVTFRTACSACGSNEYAFAPCPTAPASNGDTACATCSECDATTQYAAAPCTPTTDTACVAVSAAWRYRSGLACCSIMRSHWRAPYMR